MKVPKKFVNALRKKLGIPYGTAYYWFVRGVPKDRTDEVEQAIAEIQEQEPVEVPGWLVAPLHREMGISRRTVTNWSKYGVPANRAEEVKRAMKEMSDD